MMNISTTALNTLISLSNGLIHFIWLHAILLYKVCTELPRHSNRLSDTDSFPSIIHNTPERRNFSKGGWEKFTRDSTKKAVEELVSLPDFSKWAAANDERITVTPKSSSGTASARPRRWFLWS